MAIKGPIPVAFADVFPAGAFALSVEGQRDFDKSSRENFVQASTGEGVPLWVVHVIDGDTEARNNQLRVKIAATDEPVLPEPVPNTNFSPVEFTGLQVRPYVDRQSFAESGSDGLVFVGEKGAPLRRSNFSRPWAKALTAAGLLNVHLHDLRHTGNTLAATTGATLRELMGRMGHGSSQAAMIYLHSTSERDRAIADALGALVDEHMKGHGDERAEGEEGSA